MPWWCIVILSSIVGLNSKGLISTICSGFICGSLPWTLVLIYSYYSGVHLLIHRVSGIFGMEGLWGATLVTVTVGGIVGALGALCSYSFRIAFKDQLIRE
jgi:hypothetical protein